MCRIINPSEAFFMPPTGTDTPFLASPVLDSLCPLYSSKAAEVQTRPTTKTVLPLRSGLQFMLSSEGVQFLDLAFVEEVKARVAELISTATSSDVFSNNARLAQKTLKFRSIMQHTQTSDMAIAAL
ncbi:hypothetical protein Plhal304r1_c014g0051261 [Plasmopara halstedii]